jgi:hypothetical protein
MKALTDLLLNTGQANATDTMQLKDSRLAQLENYGVNAKNADTARIVADNNLPGAKGTVHPTRVAAERRIQSLITDLDATSKAAYAKRVADIQDLAADPATKKDLISKIPIDTTSARYKMQLQMELNNIQSGSGQYTMPTDVQKLMVLASNPAEHPTDDPTSPFANARAKISSGNAPAQMTPPTPDLQAQQTIERTAQIILQMAQAAGREMDIETARKMASDEFYAPKR